MLELDDKLQELINWIKDTYGCTTLEAISSIQRKLDYIK